MSLRKNQAQVLVGVAVVLASALLPSLVLGRYLLGSWLLILPGVVAALVLGGLVELNTARALESGWDGVALSIHTRAGGRRKLSASSIKGITFLVSPTRYGFRNYFAISERTGFVTIFEEGEFTHAIGEIAAQARTSGLSVRVSKAASARLAPGRGRQPSLILRGLLLFASVIALVLFVTALSSLIAYYAG
ncbi:hypothetical protein [Streptomyces subrutilus]|uniref:hypothetical protein n=1 Tax=Streptomyces subrutilus TaxID=36818 RepID=UPI00114D0B12|nr:hypothetical protein [Streptomyces subrutilus]